MSNIYIQEPPTNGKIMLRTTAGDVDVELWSKETPKACRNFVQLCLDKYYDGTVFHRVVKGFIAQGGDPKGDGTGGESIYGKPFRDEFHSRLRFVRRGLVAMANSGKDDNGSQFFFTLGACPDLQNKHTIFGKVAGDTLYNMLKLEDCIVNKDDRPLYPHKIISTKVLLNPFPDIVSRTIDDGNANVQKEKPKAKVKNFKLLSFGEEAEEEEIEVGNIVQTLKGKGKSSHDLANDPKLSSVSVLSLYENIDSTTEKKQQLENIRKKLKTSDSSNVEKEPEVEPKEPSPDKNTEAMVKRVEVQQQIKELTKELRKKPKQEVKQDVTVDKKETEKKKCDNPMLEDFHKQQEMFAEKRKVIPTDPEERSKMTLELLAKFQSKLQAVRERDENSCEEGDDDRWLTHKLQFDEHEVVARDVNVSSEDTYEITDPRNPINQRRRQESKEKHHHRHRRHKK